MLSFIKKLFGFGPAPVVVEVPYKVEVAPVLETVEVAPVVVAAVEGAGIVEVPAVAAKKPRAKKPAAPKAPKKPKAK